MALFRVTTEKLEPVAQTTFTAVSLFERKDLQRLLRADISPVGQDLMVVAEEFGDWDDSSRRIDLLCLSKDASLVVVEIKRTEDGGHMELQAIRYAAMVSSMTLDQAIAAYAKMKSLEPEAARTDVAAFLDIGSQDETELTTAVLWLNKRDLDITCIRLRPYKTATDVLVDATQIIPLPESAEYEVKVREQEKEKRKVVGARQAALRSFWAQLIERSKTCTQLLAGRAASTDPWLNAGLGRSGFYLQLTVSQDQSRAEFMIRLQDGADKSKAAFDKLKAQRESIEQAFGEALEWESVEGRQMCRVWKGFDGGWKSSESDWPTLHAGLIDAMIRLEAAFKGPIQQFSA